jgi:hypothetical protein
VETVTDAWDMAVVAKDGIQLGLEARSATGADGYCKLNGDSSGGAEALPACLYRWDPAATNPTDRFTPIDMSAVESIVLPPLHVAAMHVYGIRPSDLKKAIMRESPWHDELCRVRLRNATRKLLANKIPANADCRL